jgi:hypothetical protein
MRSDSVSASSSAWDVDDRHAIEKNADQQSAALDISHSASSPAEPDAAEHDDEQHVVDHRGIVDPGAHARRRGRHHQPGGVGDQRGYHIFGDDQRANRNAGVSRRRGAVARGVDVAAEAGQSKRRPGDQREQGESDDRIGRTDDRIVPERVKEWRIVGRILDVDVEQPRATDAIDHEPARESREYRRHHRVGDQHAVDDTDQDGEGAAEKQSPAEGYMGSRRHRQDPGHGDDHCRHHGEVNSASDDDKAHSKTENAQNRDAANQRHQIAGGEEIRQHQRECDEQNHRPGEDYVLLSDPDLAHLHRILTILMSYSGAPIRAAINKVSARGDRVDRALTRITAVRSTEHLSREAPPSRSHCPAPATKPPPSITTA